MQIKERSVDGVTMLDVNGKTVLVEGSDVVMQDVLQLTELVIVFETFQSEDSAFGSF